VKLYNELAQWWPLMSAPSEYAEEAAFYQRLMEEAATGGLTTVLELGSGGGNNASYLKQRFAMMLVEPSEGMRSVSQQLNPDCEHLPGDMRTVRLNRQFDAVFVHDAVAYMTTETDLAKAIETAFVHCRPGGVALFAPDFLRETFRSTTDCGGHDGHDRGLRYLEWCWDPEPSDTTYVCDYAYLLRLPDGTMQVEHDRHIEGLFGREDWLRLFHRQGFTAHSVPLEHSEVEPGAHEIFVATRPERGA
jgi:SAM-dependent methyltransferase